ncbi:hypothetical protein CSKR_112401 [Clonorchis sinensis]|uniref:Uncharacterized protein n=2 Tax=Clonorchis sinensis TaxID=79923 RepID=A0A8T1M411_CLOSI|nr:hypothetical protein CSKR_112401 [Clonorchis sinensis]GAA32243.1 hypothetical protein CLF_103384 [Clonorchis sinensis]
MCQAHTHLLGVKRCFAAGNQLTRSEDRATGRRLRSHQAMSKKDIRTSASSVSLRNDSRSQSESISYFVSSAKRIEKSTVSKKHTFTANEAEKLMKKHLKKKSIPVTIRCVEDGLHFAATTPKHQKKLKNLVTYRDIQHIFIYSLNPQLFMLCVEDSAKKGKKFYESFQCDNASDIGRICELTTEAKDAPDGKLHIRTTAAENDYQNQTDTSHEQNHVMMSQTDEERISWQPRGSSTVQVQESPKLSKEVVSLSPLELSPGSTYEVAAPVQSGMTFSAYKSTADPGLYGTVNNDDLEELTSSRITIRSVSRATGEKISRPRCLEDHNVEELNYMFGEPLTYMIEEPGGSKVSTRGPIYLYAKRVLNSSHPVSSTNSASKLRQ